jgi:hypothetical protein
MPAILLEVLLQVALATHAVRTGRTQPWLWIIIAVPGLGCLLYIAMEILPEFLHGPAGNRAARDVANVIAPEREYKRLLGVVELAPTIENKSALAMECLRVNRAPEAVELYESCLIGIHATDPKLLLGLARACFAVADYPNVVTTLDELRAHNPKYQSAEGHMLYARALEEHGRTEEAITQYEALAGYFPGEEARCRLALLLQKNGSIDRAISLFSEIVKNVERRGKAYKRTEKPWFETASRMQPSSS